MRIKSLTSGVHEGDLTPMIDMTFQLIAFFMVLINFTQSEQNEQVQLALSELAKPPEEVVEHPVTLHVTVSGDVVVGGQQVSLEGLKPILINEVSFLRARNMTPSDATVIIRGHRDVATGKVQDIIRLCQEEQFDQFVLRAKERVN